MKEFNLQDDFKDPSAEQALIAAISEKPDLFWEFRESIPANIFDEHAGEWHELATAITNGRQVPEFEGWEPACNPSATVGILKRLFLKRTVAQALGELAQQLYMTDQPASRILAQMEESLVRAQSTVMGAKEERSLEAVTLIPMVVEEARERDKARKLPLDRVSTLLGHSSIKVTERHYSPWVRARQEQLEADVRRTWGEEVPETKGTPEVHEKRELVN